MERDVVVHKDGSVVATRDGGADVLGGEFLASVAEHHAIRAGLYFIKGVYVHVSVELAPVGVCVAFLRAEVHALSARIYIQCARPYDVRCPVGVA